MSKIKILIKRAFNTKNGFLTSMILTISFVCILSASYAFFTASAERKGALNIVSGNLYSLISSTDINDEKQITINSGRTRTIKVKLINPNGIEAKFNFYYSSTSDNIEIGYTTDGDSCPTEEGITLPKNGEENDTQNYAIQITNNDTSPVTITFGSKVGLTSQDLEFPSGKHAVPIKETNNGAQDLLDKANSEDKTYTDSTDDEKHEMYCFNQPQTEQTPEQTDCRYIGDDPYNYITFNDELWRIIGVIPTQKTDTGEYENRIKIVRNSEIGTYSWDNKPSGTGSSISDWGSNNWNDARLMDTLNSGPYWNRENGTCYSGSNGATKACDFSETSSIKGLSETAKSQIEDAKWYTAGYNDDPTFSAEVMYGHERGSAVYSSNPKYWIGKVALMYPSDYEYTYAKGVDDTCYSNLYDCGYASGSSVSTGWIYNTNNTNTLTWLLTPYSDLSDYAFYVTETGYVYFNYGNVGFSYSARPVVYLKSDIKITGGDGSEGNPYTLSED